MVSKEEAERIFVPCMNMLASIEARDAGRGPCLPGVGIKELPKALEELDPGETKALALIDKYARHRPK